MTASLITPFQQQKEWNGTATDYPRNRCIHELFEQQAAATPEGVALVYGDRSLTYGELNRRANQLAHALVARGVEAETLVGVALDRSLDWVVGLLGILKAGGAYVPLDPSYPPERLAWMLADTQMPLLLTRTGLVGEFPVHDELQILFIDQLQTNPKADHNPVPTVQPHHLAYVIYTSGSTGKPKGVMVTHRSLVNLATWHQNTYDITAQARATQLASISFDASVWEIWPYICIGASLYIVDQETRLASVKLLDWLAEKQITHCFLPTPLAEAVLQENMPHSLALKVLLTGGDRLHPVPPKKLPFALVNHYGPAESTVVATYAPIEPNQYSSPLPPIGRPIANTQVYILDPELQPVPIGEEGELCISGDGLARGYLNQPALTAEKFVPHPWQPNQRLYRTGDRARFLPDGNLEFLGRLDHQLKLRGFRIEPGEIEAALLEHPAVQQALVMARGEGADKQLVAYLMLAVEVPLAQLQGHLQARVPAYMIPTAWVILASFPLNPNGKVDRSALPLPDWGQQGEAPLGATEQQLAQLWSQLLGVEAIGRQSDFFALGGHSLLAARLMARIGETFGKDLPLSALFEFPILSQLAQHIEQASAPCQPLLPVPPRPKELPLSFSQAQMWQLAQQPNLAIAYNLPFVLRLQGSLDPWALEQALLQILARHEALRTVFPAGPQSRQSILAVPQRLLQRIECPAAEMEQRIEQAARRPFDLAREIPVRVWLMTEDFQDYRLVMVFQHIAFDGQSWPILLQELAQLYWALTGHTPVTLPDLKAQYADFALWQRQVAGAQQERGLAYWKKQLADSPPAPGLFRPRLAAGNPLQGGHHRSLIPPELAAGLKTLGQQEGATLFMSLLAAFKLLLSRYSGQKDILVGSPMAERPAGTENLIGYFVNTLALRTRLTPGMEGRELIRQVRSTTLAAYAHASTPFATLVEALGTRAEQILFVLQQATPLPELPGLELSGGEYRSHTAALALVVEAHETELGIQLDWSYQTDLFQPWEIAQLAHHYQNLVQGLVADPRQPVDRLPLLGAPEIQQQKEWNGTATDYPRDRCIHELFEQQAAATPEGVALVYGDRSLTYGELNRRANQLAHALVARGVETETLVGVALDRSLDWVVGLLGILKAGGAYVPLDPSYPPERLAWMLADTQMSLLLTHSSLAGHFPPAPTQLFCLDQADLASWPAGEPAVSVCSSNLAYMIYTSGSTGRPKGVLIEHRSLVNHALGVRARYGLSRADRVLQFVSPCFDAAVEEIFPILLAGGTVVGHGDPAGLPVKKLLQYCRQHGVTTLHLPAAYWALVVQTWAQKRQRVPAWLRRVIVGGESPSLELLRQVWPPAGQAWQFCNAYGPTETTVTAACYSLASADALEGLTGLPIGRPIGNTQVYVLDEELNQLPRGVAGELCISGDGLARGYLNQPALTAEKFIAHPWQPSQRLYRTGDRARFLPDGNLEFLGRLDHQLKLRGFRIEPGEIEAALLEHPAVQQALVMARGEGADKQLVAYLMLAGEVPLAQLQGHLQARLPAYMIPTAWVILESFPLNPNGKVDRSALPLPDWGQQGEAPLGATEQQLAQLWSQLLGVEAIGRQSDFFALGGHSLLAARLMARIGETFGKDLPLSALFESPILSQLAQHIEQAQAESSTPFQARMSLAELKAEAAALSPMPTLRPGEAVPPGPLASVFLTGATGFLGAFLLAELSLQTQAQIHCLVRARDEDAAFQRIRDQLQGFGLWEPALRERIIPVLGDLAQPRLGLSPRCFKHLAAGIDAIYHNGALVNFIYPYSYLKAANVLGTREILALALQAGCKPVHLVSTLSVFSALGSDRHRLVRENDEITSIGALHGAYAQSKWLAEYLGLQAREAGLPVTIYRPGRVTGCSRTAVCNPHDFLFLLLKGCIQLGCAPELDMLVDMTPVDFVSRAIVTLSLAPSRGQAFHLLNPQPVAWEHLLAWLQSRGWCLRILPYRQWQQELAASLSVGCDNALLPLLPFLADKYAPEHIANWLLKFDTQSTQAALAQSGIVCPPVRAELLEHYFAYLIRSGFLSEPDRQKVCR